MDLAQLIADVRTVGQLASDAEAITALRTTLETLGELLPPSAAAKLGAHLPLELRPYLLETPGAAHRAFSLDEFHSRVGLRAHGRAAQGRRLSGGVLAALLNLPVATILRANVSDDYRAWFDDLRATTHVAAA